MTTIAVGDTVTVVNVFTVAPEHQRALIDILIDLTETVVATKPGCISVNLHAGLDGTTVVNYAQWRSRADLDALFTDPRAAELYAELTALGATADPHLYNVVYTRET